MTKSLEEGKGTQKIRVVLKFSVQKWHGYPHSRKPSEISCLFFYGASDATVYAQ